LSDVLKSEIDSPIYICRQVIHFSGAFWEICAEAMQHQKNIAKHRATFETRLISLGMRFLYFKASQESTDRCGSERLRVLLKPKVTMNGFPGRILNISNRNAVAPKAPAARHVYSCGLLSIPSSSGAA